MPLIIISGYPSSGKTTRALQIKSYFESRISSSAPSSRESRYRVHLIDTESLALDRSVYRDARAEKEARATEYSAVKRLISKEDIVIADGLNYIKGFRYQLYCEAKACLTPSCVVHVAAPADSCRLWNSSRTGKTPFGDVFKAAEVKAASSGSPIEGEGADSQRDPDAAPSESRAEEHPEAAPSHGGEGQYPEDVLDNLIFRYEEPNGMTRWDSPLFVVPYIDEKPDLEGIWEAMAGKNVVVRANQATVQKPAIESGYLYELDKTTQEVVSLVVEHQKMGAIGGRLPVPDCQVALELPPQMLTVPALQRMRRQFVQLNRDHAVEKNRIRELFVEYINSNYR